MASIGVGWWARECTPPAVDANVRPHHALVEAAVLCFSNLLVVLCDLPCSRATVLLQACHFTLWLAGAHLD